MGRGSRDDLPRGVGCIQRGQVFGLASVLEGIERLLSTLPNPEVSASVEVVLAYRCGAVPASHRVPFSAAFEGGTSVDMWPVVVLGVTPW